MASITVSAAVTSPPLIAAPPRSHSATIPLVTRRTQETAVVPGIASPNSSAMGTAPIAAMSARFCAAALAPMSSGADQSRRKWRPSTSRSVLATTLPSGTGSTAASSPMPTTAEGSGGSTPRIAAIRPNSPISATEITASWLGHSLLIAARPYGSVAVTTTNVEGDMVQAYILVQTEVGKAAEVAIAIGQIGGVTQADDVTGPYDVIVRAESDNVDDLGRLVVAQIQGVAGITRTLTCPIVHI